MVIFHFSSNPDGTDIIDYKPKRHRLQVNVTEVGSEREISNNGQYMQVNRKKLLKDYYLELMDDLVVCECDQAKWAWTRKKMKIYFPIWMYTSYLELFCWKPCQNRTSIDIDTLVLLKNEMQRKWNTIFALSRNQWLASSVPFCLIALHLFNSVKIKDFAKSVWDSVFVMVLSKICDSI